MGLGLNLKIYIQVFISIFKYLHIQVEVTNINTRIKFTYDLFIKFVKFLGIGTGGYSLDHCLKLGKRKVVAAQWKKCQHLIIDEVSMIDGEFFEASILIQVFVCLLC